MTRTAFIALISGVGAWFATKCLPHKAKVCEMVHCANEIKGGGHKIYCRTIDSGRVGTVVMCEECYAIYSERPTPSTLLVWLEEMHENAMRNS